MSPESTLTRLRWFLFAMAAAAFSGTLAELVLAEHWGERSQLIPFALALLGLVTVLLGAFRPGRLTLWSLRVAQAPVAFGTLLGIREHLEANAEVVHEVHAGASALEAVWGTLSGAAPVLAPGILLLSAAIALAATYHHPALASTGT